MKTNQLVESIPLVNSILTQKQSIRLTFQRPLNRRIAVAEFSVSNKVLTDVTFENSGKTMVIHVLKSQTSEVLFSMGEVKSEDGEYTTSHMVLSYYFKKDMHLFQKEDSILHHSRVTLPLSNNQFDLYKIEMADGTKKNCGY